MNKFTWIPIYRNLVLKVLEYEDKQKELIDIINTIRKHIKDKDYQPLQKEYIDPLSFINLIDIYEPPNRTIFIEEFEKLTNMDINIPKDYDGVPKTVRNVLISYNETDSNLLWNLTRLALKYDDSRSQMDKSNFIKCYDETIKRINKGNNYRIPNNLYKICPNLFLCLADPDQKILKELGSDSKKYKEGSGYLELCEEVKEKIKNKEYKTFYELSNYAYKKSKKKESESFNNNDVNYFICVSNANQGFSFLTAENGFEIKYEEKRKNNYPKNIKIGDIVIGYDNTIFDNKAAVSKNIVTDVSVANDKKIVKIKKEKNFNNPVMYYDDICDNDILYSIFLNEFGKSKGFFTIKEITKEQYDTIIHLSNKKSNLSMADLKEEINKVIKENKKNDKRKNNNLVDNSNIVGFNLIYYGIPGCGKSFHIGDKLNEIIGVDKVYSENIIRTVFYPDYTNSDFVGQIVPLMKDGKLTYVPFAGPFTKALRIASETDEAVVLIIEEINRGNAAAIFGDIFQILDREDSSNRIYNPFIEEYASSLDSDYLKSFINGGIKLPNNLWIIATMNTSDQNVYALDTAFKRRWDTKYFSNAFNSDDEIGDFYVPCSNNVKWRTFVEIINKKIIAKENNIIDSVDKQLGKYFIKDAILVKEKDSINDTDKFEKFRDKVLVYLFNDVTKYRPSILFREDIDCLDDIMTKKTLEEIIAVNFESK